MADPTRESEQSVKIPTRQGARRLGSVLGCAAAVWRNPRLRLWGGYLVLALLYTAPLYRHPTYGGDLLDWRFCHYLDQVSRTTVLQFHEFPFWNPWGCGGNVHLANVQTQFLSPYFLLVLLFGVTVSAKLFVLIHYWLGLVGTHLLVTRAGRPALAGVASAVAFSLCGFFAVRAGGGHASFLAFLYLPWLLIAYDAARARLRYSILVGLILVECLLEGGVYPTPFFALVLVFQATYDVVTGPVARWRPLAVGAIALAVLVSVSAVKLFPTLQFISDAPRVVPLDDRLDLTLLLRAFLSHAVERHLAGHEYVWPEYLNYIGVITVLAFFVMWTRRDEEPLRRWYYAILVFALLMIGDHGRYSPYALLHRLPLFDSLRVPARYAVIVDLHLALIFGVFINWLDFKCEDWARQFRSAWLARPIRSGAYALLVLTTIELGISNGRQWWPGFNVKPPPVERGELFQGHGGGDDMWWRVRNNEGTPHCYEANFIPTAAGIWRGRGPQVKLVDASAGTLTIAAITPNRWRLQVDLSKPSTLLVNQNYHRFWRLAAGEGAVVNHQGLLAVELPAGAQEIALRYYPQHFGWFALLSLLGLVACGAGLLRPWSWRRGSG
ncbi:MAG: hypothetical protein JXR83_03245 [Deltaproteobacteria bacterium]|nr:hypothetical protein [Deltaproteobacteria bacterium]